MSSDPAALALALQLGDSQFPAGGFAFSWGLEALWRERRIDRAAFPAVLAAQLHGRWASFDRAFVAQARGAGFEARAALDREVEAMCWSAAQRDGSRRAGGALLHAHAALGTADAAHYREAVRAGDALGHLPVAQGLVLAGLERPAALTVAGMGFAAGLASAAVRLGMVGALAAQRHLADLRPQIAALAAAPPPARPTSFAPLADIAMCRHAAGALFAN